VSSFYGLHFRELHLKPYAMLLLCMLPLLAWAAFQPDFLRSYPMYRSSEAHLYFDVPEWVTALVYELCYGWDFIMTELLFRGVMVIGAGVFMGRSAILPMVTVYCFLHYGKPLGETIGSIFGGYILGVIAYYSQNILGGVLIHLGIAWLMELLAFVQKAIGQGE